MSIDFSNSGVSHDKRVELGHKVARLNGFKSWNDWEIEQLKKLYLEGKSYKQISEVIDRTPSAIKSKAANIHLSFIGVNRHKFSLDDDKYIKKNYGLLPVKEIADYLNISPSSVMDRATKRLKLKKRYWGLNNSNGTVTDEDIELIRCLSDEGLGSPLISEKMEVSASYVRKIVKYKTRTEFTFANGGLNVK